MCDGNLAALAKYEAKMEEVEKSYHEMRTEIDDKIDEIERLIEEIKNTYDSYGFEFERNIIEELI